MPSHVNLGKAALADLRADDEVSYLSMAMLLAPRGRRALTRVRHNVWVRVSGGREAEVGRVRR